MTVPPLSDYQKHSENVRLVAKGLTQAELAHKAAIRGGQDGAIAFAARMHYLTVGLLAEVLLRKTIADAAGFNARERQLLSQERNQVARWQRAVDLALRRQYTIPVHLEIDAASAGAVVAGQSSTLNDLLSQDLSEIIEDRNNIAHGQWAWLLNSKGTAFTRHAYPPLNYRAIEIRGKLLRELDALIRDLVISEATFVRDYTVRYQEIQRLKTKINGPDYAALVAQLKARRR